MNLNLIIFIMLLVQIGVTIGCVQYTRRRLHERTLKASLKQELDELVIMFNRQAEENILVLEDHLKNSREVLRALRTASGEGAGRVAELTELITETGVLINNEAFHDDLRRNAIKNPSAATASPVRRTSSKISVPADRIVLSPQFQARKSAKPRRALSSATSTPVVASKLPATSVLTSPTTSVVSESVSEKQLSGKGKVKSAKRVTAAPLKAMSPAKARDQAKQPQPPQPIVSTKVSTIVRTKARTKKIPEVERPTSHRRGERGRKNLAERPGEHLGERIQAGHAKGISAEGLSRELGIPLTEVRLHLAMLELQAPLPH